MFHRHVFLKATAADTNEGNPVAVTRIHICLELEHKSAEPLPQWIPEPLAARTGNRTLRHFEKRIEKRSHPEVGHG